MSHSAENDAPRCGPCRRGQHGCCDGGLYVQCECCVTADPCIAPPGNLCLDTGCWDADRCVVTRVIPPGNGGGSDG